MTTPPSEPSLTPVGQLRVNVAAPVELGASPLGRRRMIAILGGTLEGEIGTGTVLPGGADWQAVHDDGSVTITAEYTIELEEGDVMTLRSIGVRAMRDGADAPPHFRTSIVFAAESHRTALNHNLYVSTGLREGGTVTLNLFRVD